MQWCFLGVLMLGLTMLSSKLFAGEISWPKRGDDSVITTSFSMLEDEGKRVSLQKAIELGKAGEFNPIAKDLLGIEVGTCYWLHGRLEAGEGKQGILELDEPALYKVSVFLSRENNSIDSWSSGVSVAPDEKAIKGGRIAFTLEGGHEIQDLWIKIESKIPMVLAVNWYSRSGWESSQKLNGVLMGGLISLFILVLGSGIFLFLVQKRLIYLSLLGFLLTYGTGFSLIFGIAYEWAYLPGTDVYVPFLMGGSQFFILLAYYLWLSEQDSRFGRWRKGFGIASVVVLAFPLLGLMSEANWVPIAIMLGIITVALGLILSTCMLHSRGLKGVILFLLPLSFHLVAIGFGIFTRLRILNVDPGNKSVPLFCLMLEMILFLLIIHYQYSQLVRARNEAERLLERSQLQLDLLRARLVGLGLKEADSAPLEEDRSEIKQALADEQLTKGLVNPLSQRELEVLNAVAKGMTNRQVAESLFISINTVKTHLLNIYEKLDAKNRTEAARKADRLNLLS